jgi:hypothetical protein
MRLLTTLVVLWAQAEATNPPPEILRVALQQELEIVQQDPEQYYLIVDLFSNVIELKAGARILLSASIREAAGISNKSVITSIFEGTISPHIRLRSFAGSRRLADRRLPLDFVGRLIEGPRKSDRLYFQPGLLIESGHTVAARVTRVQISGSELKSLSSAMVRGTPAILMQPVLSNP